MTTRSARSSASSWSWVTNSVVMPSSSWISRSQRRRSRRTLASSAPNGSSSSSTFGSTASARASATRWRWPPEICAGKRSPRPSSLTSRSRSRDARRRSPPSCACTLRDLHAEGDVLGDRHMREERVVLEDEADAAVAHRNVGRVLVAEIDVAAIGDIRGRRPCAGCVVLPEPEGPSSATSSPLSMSSETPCTARNVSKVFTTLSRRIFMASSSRERLARQAPGGRRGRRPGAPAAPWR